MSSNFSLKLMDRLSAPARAMSRALASLLASERAVTAAAQQSQVAVTAAGQAAATAGARAAAGASGFDKAAAAMKRMKGAAGAGHASAVKKAIGGVGGQKYDSMGMPLGASITPAAAPVAATMMDRVKGLVAWNSAAGDSIEKWQDLSAVFMRTPFGMVVGGLGKIGGFLFDIVQGLASMLFTATKVGLALGAIAAISFTKLVVEMGAFAEKSKRALAFITGSDALGRREFREAVSLSAKLGTNLEDTVSHYSKLRSMQFSASESAGLVKLSTDLKAITGDAQSAERALTAMTQIKAKGKLQSEELVGQLAEAGVSTVLVYKELEKILNTDRAGVLKRLQGGNIDSETGLVAVVRALKQKYHVQNVGTIGEQFANETLSGMWESLKNTPARTFMRLGEQIDTTPLVAGLQTLKRALDGAFSGGSGVRFVNTMVAGLGKLIPMVVAFAEGFGSGLDEIARALSLGDASNVIQWAREAGTWVARFFARVIEVTKNAVPAAITAIKGLFEGLDIEGLLADMKGANWKGLGADLAIVARAVGSITHNAATLVGLFGHSSESSGPLGLTKGAREAAGTDGKNWWDLFVEGQVDPESAAGKQGRALRVEPRIDPAAMSRNMTNHITVPLTVNGSAGPDEQKAVTGAAEEGVLAALRKFADGELSQATA